MAKSRTQKIFIFYSPQGGTGKSTIAINASVFACKLGLRVLLVDMSIFGNVVSTLRIQQKGGTGLSSVLTYLDLQKQNCEIRSLRQTIERSIVNHRACKLDVLTSANPIRMESITEQHINSIVKCFKELNYDAIVIDTSSELSIKNLILIENADRILIPLEQDISVGWKMVLLKEVLGKCFKDDRKYGLIINKCNKNSGFNNIEFENELGYKTIGEIAYFGRKFQNYINEGRLISEKYNKKAYNQFLILTKAIFNLG